MQTPVCLLSGSFIPYSRLIVLFVWVICCYNKWNKRWIFLFKNYRKSDRNKHKFISLEKLVQWTSCCQMHNSSPEEALLFQAFNSVPETYFQRKETKSQTFCFFQGYLIFRGRRNALLTSANIETNQIFTLEMCQNQWVFNLYLGFNIQWQQFVAFYKGSV